LGAGTRAWSPEPGAGSRARDGLADLRAQPADVAQAETNRAVGFDRAIPVRDLHVDRMETDAAALTAAPALPKPRANRNRRRFESGEPEDGETATGAAVRALRAGLRMLTSKEIHVTLE